MNGPIRGELNDWPIKKVSPRVRRLPTVIKALKRTVERLGRALDTGLKIYAAAARGCYFWDNVSGGETCRWSSACSILHVITFPSFFMFFSCESAHYLKFPVTCRARFARGRYAARGWCSAINVEQSRKYEQSARVWKLLGEEKDSTYYSTEISVLIWRRDLRFTVECIHTWCS